MTPISQEEIDAMRRSGYDEAIIREATERLDRYRRGLELTERIAEAFRGVTLGNGTGLQQANGLDDYEDEATLVKLRDEDEKESWERIPASALHHVTSFFDSEGMRFHLPAYLIADLKGLYGCGMIFELTHLSRLQKEQFSLLNGDQRRVVREFLALAREDPGERFHHVEIDKALAEYWRDDGEV